MYKDVNGPHGRTIWYTQEQLVTPRPSSATTGVAKSTSSDLAGDVGSRSLNDNTMNTTAKLESTAELLSHLADPSWKQALMAKANLGDESSAEWFSSLAAFVAEERRVQEIYPPTHQVFAALNLCPLDQVKVVIVGQDPYHGPGQGHGLAFSVQHGVKLPPSLVNIFKEAHADVGTPFPPSHGNLAAWARQGVLLLNTVLTVRRGQANSHAGHGWETFTDVIIEILNEQKEDLVFLLWGKPAQRKASAVDESKHFVIRTSHPSPLGATKTNEPFIGSRCFSKANKLLEQSNRSPIDWHV